MRKRAFSFKVRAALQSNGPTKRQGSRKKMSVLDEKSRDYVPRKEKQK